MIVPYHEFCRVRFRHTYFADQVCCALVAAPTPTTAEQLRRAGLLFHGGPDGFVLLCPTPPGAAPPSPAGLFPLLFTLQVLDPAFLHYSDLPPDPGPDRVYCLRLAPDPRASTTAGGSTADAPCGPARGIYERRLGEGEEGTEDFDHPVHPWGLLVLGADLLVAEPAVYTLTFRARPTIWRYHLRLRGAAPLTGAVIQTGTDVAFAPCPVSSEENGAGLCFEASAPIPLAERYEFPPFRLLFAARGSVRHELLALLPPATPASVRCEGASTEAVFVSDIVVHL